MTHMDQLAAKAFIDALWDAEVIPELTRYIRIPNKSPAFDPDWAAHGYMEAATQQFAAWAQAKIEGIDGARLEVVRLEGRTPVILIEIPGSEEADGDDPVLLYGHLDKQPEMTGWAEGLGPWEPCAERRASSMDAAARTTATPCSGRCRRSWPCASRDARMPAAPS